MTAYGTNRQDKFLLESFFLLVAPGDNGHDSSESGQFRVDFDDFHRWDFQVSKNKISRNKPKSNWRVAQKAPTDDLEVIRQQYDKVVRQLCEIDATLEREGLIITVPVFSRSGKEVGQKQQRHPLAAIQKSLRTDVVRLARVLQLHKPVEPEAEKPVSARDQKKAVERLYERAWELFIREGEMVAQRDAEWTKIRRNPWRNGEPPEWIELQEKIKKLNHEIAKFV